MKTIPADVMDEARKITRAPIADDDGNCLAYFAGSYTEQSARVVAYAILAERERCLKLVRSVNHTDSFAHADLADAIENGSLSLE